ncbi:MAG: DUF2147 domain-containing protein [Alphaproteobacteria bacterium]
MKKPRSLRSITAAVSSAFCIAAAQAMPATDKPVPPPSNSETLWKTETFDAVVSLRPCPETGACGYIYWLNPADKKLYDYFGERKSFDEPVTETDVKSLCGFTPKMNFTPATAQNWEGRMEMRGMGMNVNVTATPLDENRLRVVFSKGIFRQTETWTKISPDDKRYPRCDSKKAQP